MGELSEQRWAVISERGCEAQGLPHAEAAALVRRLRGERISGLCVVTAEVGRRIQASQTPSNGAKPAAGKTARKQRTAKR